ncbi:MAG: hypothetical protein WC708_14280 [Lentisphaeria bacterium]
MRQETKKWLHHVVFPHTAHDMGMEWRESWHDHYFLCTVGILVGAFLIALVLLALWLQPEVAVPTESGPLTPFASPWQRGWPYPMW